MEDADDDGLDDLIDAAVLNVRDPKHSVVARLKSRLPKPAAPVSREPAAPVSRETGWVLRDQVAALFPSMAAQVDAMAAQVAAITGLDDFAQKQWQQSAQEQARRTGEMWPDARPLWTASVPCQPFSAAGKQRGFADDRDLWPDFMRLVRACRPGCVAGEQVASAAGPWLHRARADMEAEGYDFQCVSLPACAVDAPHIRQRLWWVAINVEQSAFGRCDGGPRGAQEGRWELRERECVAADETGALAHADRGGRGGRPEDAQRAVSCALHGRRGAGVCERGRGAGARGRLRCGELGQLPQVGTHACAVGRRTTHAVFLAAGHQPRHPKTDSRRNIAKSRRNFAAAFDGRIRCAGTAPGGARHGTSPS